jgi:hypothetical protein
LRKPGTFSLRTLGTGDQGNLLAEPARTVKIRVQPGDTRS